MREDRLEELLRDARAHPAEPLPSDSLRIAQARALARFAQESAASAPRRKSPVLRALEFLALPAAAAGVLFVAADWLGSLWASAQDALQRAPELPALEPGWAEELGGAMAAQPWMVICGAVGLAMLWLPPVRAALLGERE